MTSKHAPKLSVMQIEHLLDLCLKGICMGYTRKETHDLVNAYLETQNLTLTPTSINRYYYKAREQFRTPKKLDRTKQKAQALNKYEKLHNLAIKKGDLKTAQSILERLDKLKGLDENDSPDQTINIVFKDAKLDDV